MAIPIKLPREAKGKELAKIIEESLNSLEDYNVVVINELSYAPGSVKEEPTKTYITANKKKD